MAIRTSGSGESILYQDARDLGEWESTPPAVMGDGKIIFLPRVPPLAEWVARDVPPTEANADPGSMIGGIGQLFGS